MERVAVMLGLVLLGSLGCGGSESDEEPEGDTEQTTGSETTTDGDASASAPGIRTRTEDEIPSPPSPWSELSVEERGQFMRAEVLPYMRTLFQEYDSERYGEFGCESCHGASMNEQGFEMPNPDILALHPSGTDEQRTMVEEHPRMVRFMFNHVVPAMKQMIDAPDFDPGTGEGFSCFFCHPRAEAETAPAASD